MSAPVIAVVPAGPITAPVGTVLTFAVTATDADNRVETLQITGTDPEGNVSQVAEVKLTWVDPVTVHAGIKEAGSPTVVTVAGSTVTVAG